MKKSWANPIPQAAPPGGLRDVLLAMLVDFEYSQRDAARLLSVDERTMRRWCQDEADAGHRVAPWASVELLRRLLLELK